MFTQKSPENYRIGETQLFGIENSYKAIKGRYQALITPTLWNQKVERERVLRAKVNARATMRKKYGSAWDDVARATAMFQPRRKEFKYIEQGAGFSSPLYRIARDLVRGTEELQKPNEQRLREYTDGKLPQLKQKLFSKAPIYEEFELFKLSYGLTKLREELGADHPFVKKVLGKKSPQELAQELVKTKLHDLKLREQLWQAGREAVLASNDPMIQFARLVDADARPIRMWHDEEIETLEVSGAERVAAAKFDIEGKSNYPDATFTLRLSYGTVKGYEENGHHVAPFTAIGGAFERATGRDPFKLPESWIRANVHHQRHHRRQLRISGLRQGPADRRPGLRRQHPVLGRRLRFRSHREPHHLRPQLRPPRSPGPRLLRQTHRHRAQVPNYRGHHGLQVTFGAG
jgi:hypothetical protein